MRRVLGGLWKATRERASVQSLYVATHSVQIPWEKDLPLQELMVVAQGAPSLL